ncbi:hypothetical protein SDJN02_18436, partial [Cucurbita argyrosperma subsp. argyrosperma]
MLWIHIFSDDEIGDGICVPTDEYVIMILLRRPEIHFRKKLFSFGVSVLLIAPSIPVSSGFNP